MMTLDVIPTFLQFILAVSLEFPAGPLATHGLCLTGTLTQHFTTRADDTAMQHLSHVAPEGNISAPTSGDTDCGAFALN